ncbi:MAG: RHS repeat protein, partial [Anaerolineales bacterium]|nr:RHS repeat protein [Anaerolineales bacterium]
MSIHRRASTRIVAIFMVAILCLQILLPAAALPAQAQTPSDSYPTPVESALTSPLSITETTAIESALTSPLPTPTPYPTPEPTPEPEPGPIPTKDEDQIPVWVQVMPRYTLAEPGETVTLTLTAGKTITGPASIQLDLPSTLTYVPDSRDGLKEKPVNGRLVWDLQDQLPNTFILKVRVASELTDDLVFCTFETYSREEKTQYTQTATIQIQHPSIQADYSKNANLQSSGGRVTVEITTAIKSVGMTYTPVELPANLLYVKGPSFELSTNGKNVNGPYRIEISFKDMPGIGNHTSSSLLAIFHYDSDAKEWTRLDSNVLEDEEVVWAETNDLGFFTLATSTSNTMGSFEQPWTPTIQEHQVDLFTGAARWNVPLDIPASRAGQKPTLNLSYNSGIIDEMRGRLNPQASWVGAGWNLEMGYIVREIEPDPNFLPEFNHNFRIVLNGVSSELVCIDEVEELKNCVNYRTKDEQFWKIQRLDTNQNKGGDYWKVTTKDGTQYRFGYNSYDTGLGGIWSHSSAWWLVSSGCNGGDELCAVNWRWNLDNITDTNNKTIGIEYYAEHNNFCFFYDGEFDCYTNYDYCQSAGGCRWQEETGYIRGGYISQIGYSNPNETHTIHFNTTTRSDYPSDFDSPGSGPQFVQTFWTKYHLEDIEVKRNLTTSQEIVRVYDLDTGYWNTNYEDILFLKGIQEKGTLGETSLPNMSFSYHNNFPSYQKDGYDKKFGWKPWLDTVNTGYSSTVNFNYTAPQGIQPVLQNGQIKETYPDDDDRYWYRYRVREVTTDPGVGPVMRTIYEYRVQDPTSSDFHSGTWNSDEEFRGHPRVRVLQRGEGTNILSYSDTYFHQGMGGTTASGLCGHSVSDPDGMEGLLYQTVNYDANDTVLARTGIRYTFTDLGDGRHFIEPIQSCQQAGDGSSPESNVTYTYDDYGNIIQEFRQGNVDLVGDEVTVVREFVPNEDDWIVGLPSSEKFFGSPNTSLTTETRYAYDEQEWGSAPITGSLTQVTTGQGSLWATSGYDYDAYGNQIASTDSMSRTTRTGYDPIYHLYPISVTNTLSQTVLTGWEPVLGLPVLITDSNGAVKAYDYDQYGRLVSVTGSDPSTGQLNDEPDLVYQYPNPETVENQLIAPFAISVTNRIGVEEYHHTWTLYDGLGRAIQSQEEAGGGILVLAHTGYDVLGFAVKQSLPVTVTAAGGVYVQPNWSNLNATETEYDALGRPVSVTASDDSETVMAYDGWRTLVLDPEDHQSIAELDGLGRLVAVVENNGTRANPDWEAGGNETRYWYNAADQLIAVQDAE